MKSNEPAAWPCATIAECQDKLCAAGEYFEMETVDIRGHPTRVWKNAPANFAALAERARRHGDATFIVYESDRVSYEGWYRAVSSLSRHLQDSGVGRGDRVAIAMRNLPEWPIVFFAATVIGAIAVPLNAWWSADELTFGIDNSGAQILICDGERHSLLASRLSGLPLKQVLVARASGLLAPGYRSIEAILGYPGTYENLPDQSLPHVAVAADDMATIFYTSGTTSRPKGVIGSQRVSLSNIHSSAYSVARAAVRRGAEWSPPVPKTILLSIPFFHVTGCNARLLGSMWNGDKMVLMRKWDALEAFALIEREKVTNAGGVPAIAWQILDHPERDRFDLRSLESLSYGGAPAASELVRRIFGDMKLSAGYGWGMTETGATATIHSGEDYRHRPESCGLPVPVAELKIVDPETLETLPAGTVGEVWAFGPMVAEGYWLRPDETDRCFVDGWVRTGDLGKIDEEGFLFLVDRLKDIIIRGGENIYSTEVENILFDHPAVTDAAVFARPDKVLGEVPVAVVHLVDGASAAESELRAWVRAKLAAFKVPERVFIASAPLPRNANGKILKKELAAFYLRAS